MFNTLGVALYCLLGACPVFVAGTGRKMSSPYRDDLTLTHRVSGVHVHIVHQLLPVPFRSVPFRSVPGFIASPRLKHKLCPGGSRLKHKLCPGGSVSAETKIMSRRVWAETQIVSTGVLDKAHNVSRGI